VNHELLALMSSMAGIELSLQRLVTLREETEAAIRRLQGQGPGRGKREHSPLMIESPEIPEKTPRKKTMPREPVPCPVCRRSFMGATGLATHMRKAHPSRPYKPQSERAGWRQKLRQEPKAAQTQVSVTPGTNNVPCPHCDRRFKDRRSLATHIRVSHPKEWAGRYMAAPPEKKPVHFTCPVCKQGFTNRTGALSHIRIKHPGSNAAPVAGGQEALAS
jgi:uncharacterized C2H2 Zn-finger protein